MKLSKVQIEHVAKLANLTLSEKEEEIYSEQLSKILDYIDQLSKVNTDKVEPTFNVTGKVNVLREDEAGPVLSQDLALSNAPKQDRGFFVTKGVFETE